MNHHQKKSSRPSDAYGQLLRDTHLGRNPVEIVERDDGHIDAAFRMAHYTTLTPLDRRMLNLARGRTLDIGCGLGRHALYLQQCGVDVVAIDSSPLAAKLARLRAVRNARHMSIEALPGNLIRLGRFDTLLLMGNNFGLLGSQPKARRLLKVFHALTSPAARIIAETTNPHPAPDAATRAYLAANRRRGRMPGQIRMRIRHRAAATPWFDYLYASPAEMRALLAGTGWRMDKTVPGPGQTYFAVLQKAAD